LKADFLFVELNLSTNFQAKTPETCTFHGLCFKKKKHQKYLNVETRLLFSPDLMNILATRLVGGCTASIYQNILWFVFGFIYVVIVTSSTFYLSELTKFELIITVF